MSADSPGRFDRTLGLLDCILLSVGGMVGSAIFVFPGSTGRLAGAWAGRGWSRGTDARHRALLHRTHAPVSENGRAGRLPYETFGPSPAVPEFASYLEGIGYASGWVFGITVSALAITDYLARLVPAAADYTVALTVLAVALAGYYVLQRAVSSRMSAA